MALASKNKIQLRDSEDIPPIPFILPRIQLEIKYVDDEYALQYAEGLPFSSETLAWALQNSFSFEAIKKYIESYRAEAVQSKVNVNIETDDISLPVLFFAVERNCTKTVRFLLELGALPNARTRPYSVPVLGFAIMHAENDLINTTDVVTTLLGLGAPPYDIPKDMWVDFIKAPRVVREPTYEPELGSRTPWCSPPFRAALARTLNLSQRYFLAKTATLKRPSGRAKQVAAAHKVTALLEAPYHLIGQAPATDMVLSRVFGHIALCADTPLVLLYAGPSGHGKTELAKQMGTLMSVDTLVVDCTEMRYETDMFGPKHPYAGSSEGSPLNNYLAQHSGGRSIVFLDEFEKTTDNVRRALLLAFDSGTTPSNHQQTKANPSSPSRPLPRPPHRPCPRLHPHNLGPSHKPRHRRHYILLQHPPQRPPPFRPVHRTPRPPRPHPQTHLHRRNGRPLNRPLHAHRPVLPLHPRRTSRRRA